MATIYRNDLGGGKFSPWSYFSESQGKILEFETEATAQAALAAEGPAKSISSALGGIKDEAETTSTEDDGADDESGAGATESENPESLASPARKRGRPRKPVAPEPKCVLSAAFVKKIKERLAGGTASLSVELERWLIARFGFTTEDLDDDDPDVEILKMGWEALWESYLAGREPPAWLLICFGHTCITVRLIANAKRKEKVVTNAGKD
jgi:hypothetical protein